MPVYEYNCTACNTRFEIMQRFSDPPAESCEHCGGKLKKLISNTSFVLKGSGWYVTDYARAGSNGTGASGGATGSSAKAEADSGSKSDSGSSTSTPSPAGSSASTPSPNAGT